MSSRLVKFVSWNINGCGSPLKSRKIISFLKNNQGDAGFFCHMQGIEAEKFKTGLLGHVFHSSFSSKRNSVLILIHRNISFVLLKQTKDAEGRIVCAEAVIEGMPVLLCNIYAPNKGDPNFFHVVNKILGDTEGQIILAGDFNEVIDPRLG